jgi:ElaB/YqjD/DUF883 family membrane-anchored ribosome-binding protein
MKTIQEAKKEFTEYWCDRSEREMFQKDFDELLNLQSQEQVELYENNNPGCTIWTMIGIAFGVGIIVGFVLKNLIN